MHAKMRQKKMSLWLVAEYLVGLQAAHGDSHMYFPKKFYSIWYIFCVFVKYEHSIRTEPIIIFHISLCVCRWQYNHYVFVMDCFHVISSSNVETNFNQKKKKNRAIRATSCYESVICPLSMCNYLRNPYWNRFIAHLINPTIRVCPKIMVTRVSVAQWWQNVRDNVSLMRWTKQVT